MTSHESIKKNFDAMKEYTIRRKWCEDAELTQTQSGHIVKLKEFHIGSDFVPEKATIYIHLPLGFPFNVDYRGHYAEENINYKDQWNDDNFYYCPHHLHKSEIPGTNIKAYNWRWRVQSWSYKSNITTYIHTMRLMLSKWRKYEQNLDFEI